VSGTLVERLTPFFHKKCGGKIGVLLMVLENTVSGATPESPISVQLGWHMVNIVFMLFKPFSVHS
jgi:hypothetical protein